MTDGHRWIVDHKDKLQFFIDFVKDQFEQGNHLVYSIKPAGRTERQNNAMHLWFREMAEKLNDAGYSNAHPFNDQVEIPFTEGLVKEMLYKPIIKAMYQKTSTTKLTGRELSEAAEVLVRWLSEKKGIYVPFPQTLKDEL
jgi:hypothetical protein